MLIFAGFQRDSVFSQGLRMAVGQIGIVPFDAERLKRLYVIRERLRVTEPKTWTTWICSMANMTDAVFDHRCSGHVAGSFGGSVRRGGQVYQVEGMGSARILAG
jgi:hypothetical protein